jgi:hypothetical protein
MKPKLIFTLLYFSLVFILFSSKSLAQTLPVYQYVGGGHSGKAVGQTITDNNASYPNLVVKRYGPPRFELVTNTNTITLGGGLGCEPGDTLADGCNVDEVWRTNAAVAPILYRATTYDHVLVNLGWVNKLNATGQQCKFEYVLIDDAGDTTNKEGFYITTSTWTTATLPGTVTFCTQGYTPPSTTNTLIPVYCDPGPTSTLVTNGSFTIPRNGNLYLVTKESIGVAGSVSCKPDDPPPPVETDFTGFLWKIDPADPSCQSNATSSQRANCKMDSTNLTGNVRLRFYREDAPTTQIGPDVYYRPGSTPPDYDIDNLVLDGMKVKVCVALFQMVDPAGGSYDLAGAQMGTTSIGKSGNCTAFFTPASFGGNNNVHLSFNYSPPSYDPPWFTTINGDIYSGNNYSISNPDIPASGGAFTNHTINGKGFALGDGGFPTRYAENGMGIAGFTDTSLWPPSTVFPPTYSSANLWTGGYSLTEGMYNLNAVQLQNWLNGGSSYTVSGTSKLAILKVSGASTITVTKDFKAGDSASRIIIIGPDLSFEFKTTVASNWGVQTPGLGSASNFDAGLIVGGSITFLKDSAPVDRSLIYNGFAINNGMDKDITFTWDRGPSNPTYPSTIVRYDPLYIFALQDLELSGKATGLTDFDLTWEVLD